MLNYLFFIFLVCVKLYQVVTKYLQTHTISLCYNEDHFPLLKQPVPLEKLFSICPKLTCLKLRNYRCSITDQISNINTLNHMKELQLHLYILKPTAFQFQTLLSKCPNLERLVLNEFQFCAEDKFNFNLDFSHLKHLELISVNVYSFQYLITKLRNQLTSLIAEFFELRTSLELINVIKCINENCGNLKDLSLFVSYVDGHLECLPKIKNIERLKLELSDHNVPISFIEDMLRSSRSLKSLHLFFRSSVSHDQILELCSRYCKNIEIINNHSVLGDTSLTEEGLKCWRRINTLKYFLYQDYDFWKVFCRQQQHEEKEEGQER